MHWVQHWVLVVHYFHFGVFSSHQVSLGFIDRMKKTRAKKFTRRIKQPAAFFKELKAGEVFTYSFSSMMFRDVMQEAKSHGVQIEYLGPGTQEYNLFGCCTCRRVK